MGKTPRNTCDNPYTGMIGFKFRILGIPPIGKYPDISTSRKYYPLNLECFLELFKLLYRYRIPFKPLGVGKPWNYDIFAMLKAL